MATTVEDRVEAMGNRIGDLARNPDVRYGATIAFGALLFLVFVGIIYPAPISVLVQGAMVGSLSALLAIGLILIYRANRVINFAQGDLGGAAAVLAALLIGANKWPFFPAVLVGLVVAIAIGFIVQVTLIRRFAKAPRLILTVATIGVAQILAGLQLFLPQLFDFNVAPAPPIPFKFRLEWSPVTFNAGYLMVAIIVPAVAIGLAAFFRFTRVGIAVRASAESADRAALLGVPVRRINTLVWVIAAGLSGLAVLLRLPIEGVGIGAVLGPTVLLRGLTAAVIARMERIPAAVGASLVLGAIESAVLFRTRSTLVADGVLFFIIVGALLLQRRGTTTRAEDIGASTWTANREVRPIPRELRRVPEVRYGVLVLGAAALALLFFAPDILGPDLNFFSVGVIFAMAIASLVVLTGMAGQITLGHAAFIAFGASVAGVLAQQGKDFFVTLVVAGLVGAVLALAIGLPALRFGGLFLAVSTLAFAISTGTYFLNEQYFGWLVPDPSPRIVRPVIFNKFDLESDRAFYYVLLVAFLLVVASVASVRRSRIGRVLVATRDNARAAQSYGVSPVMARLFAFAMSGFIAAFAGAFYVWHQHGPSGTVADPLYSVRLLAMGVIGGLGSIPGAMLGAAFQTFLDYSPLTRLPLSRLFASGAGLLLVLLFIPNGLSGVLYDGRDWVLRRIARRRNIVVPSLVADILVADDGTTVVGFVDEKEKQTRSLLDRVRERVPFVRRAASDGDGAAGEVPQGDNILVVRGLDVAYGRTQVLFGVNFYVRRGEIVALLGTNGAGKSTLLNAINGLVPSQAGTIVYDGADITASDPQAVVGAGIVTVPGGKGVFPTLTVGENLRLAAWLYNSDPEYVQAATEQVLTYFPILRSRGDQKAGNLSGGEQQMLTLGQAFIAKPKLLMIDELSLGLAPLIVEQLLGIVQAIHAGGTTIVLVEQSVNLAITLAGRAVFMEKGEVRFDGPTGELLERPDVLHAVFLKGAAAAQGATIAANGDRPKFEPVCHHCGREHPVALEVTGLSVSFGGVLAVDSVDLTVRRGEVIGIIGPNGAGKTTVFDAISGFVPRSGGRVWLNDIEITELSPDGRAAIGLGRSFQDARLFPSMTVRQVIAVARERHIRTRDPLAAALISPATRISEKLITADVDRLIELMHLGAFADKFVGELSTGTRRIVDLAASLAHEPQVLLLDEPSSGIAQRETEALGPALLDIRDQTGAALVVIEHDMPLITSISDELIALDLGAVVTRGEPDEVINHPKVVEGYLGGREEVIQRSGTVKKTTRARKAKKKAVAR
ncbi:MAG: ATP-binding cassette domain-containing protein [Actinobacteria bacterium]|nr:ATP-binding cassette domain-containing protein [Actinomycetota bacterium]